MYLAWARNWKIVADFLSFLLVKSSTVLAEQLLLITVLIWFQFDIHWVAKQVWYC